MKKMIYILFIINLVLLVVALIFEPSGYSPHIFIFVGRFHPMILHFPIGLLAILPVLEFLGSFSRFKELKNSTGFLLGLAALLSPLTSSLGLFLYLSGDYGGEIITYHMWGGIALSFSTVLLLFAKIKHEVSYYFGLIVMLGVLVFTGHHGGSLTHGENYLTEYFPFGKAEKETLPPLEKMLVFDHVILPILEQKCATCHNETKLKGDLRLDSYEFLLKGGEDEGPAITPDGGTEKSSLYNRISLGEQDGNVMPPKGKRKLTHDEKQILAWWIETGGKNKTRVVDLKPNDSIKKILDAMTNKIDAEEVALRREKIKDEIAALEKKYGIAIRFEGNESYAISINTKFSIKKFKDEDLSGLLNLEDYIVELNLEDSEITDEAMKAIAQFSKLKKLNLRACKITHNGLKTISVLPELKSLNLAQTSLGDDSLDVLKDFKKLTTVYLWGTPSAETGIEDLKKHIKNVEWKSSFNSK